MLGVEIREVVPAKDNYRISWGVQVLVIVHRLAIGSCRAYVRAKQIENQ